jgi:outer membrane protein assembly factor BamD (BamD/ComL family)
MKYLKFIALTLLIFAQQSCSNPQKELHEKIISLENEFKKNLSGKIEQAKVNELIKLYEEYATKYKSDSLTTRYIFETANLYMGQNNPNKAIAACDKIIKESPQLVNAYFFKGFIFDEKLKDVDNAKAAYKEVYTRFPQSDLADDSKILFERAGKPMEEWINEIAKNDTTVAEDIVK